MIDTNHVYTIIYCTWLDQDTDAFLCHFPTAIIHKVPQPTVESEEYKVWSASAEYTYELYHIYLMMYAIREASRVADELHAKDPFDICIRVRPDCIFKFPIIQSYAIPENTIIITPYPYYTGICDFFWLGRFHECSTVMKYLDILLANRELRRQKDPEAALLICIKTLQYTITPIEGLEMELIRDGF